MVATYITIGLYLFIYLGMMAQVVLGPLQLLLAIIISLRYYKILDQHNQILIMYYWFSVVISLSIAAITWFGYPNSITAIIWVIVVPMLVACYFLYVTKSLNRYINSVHEIAEKEKSICHEKH